MAILESYTLGVYLIKVIQMSLAVRLLSSCIFQGIIVKNKLEREALFSCMIMVLDCFNGARKNEMTWSGEF